MFMSARMFPRGHVTARNIGGRSPDDPVGRRPDPRALSRPIIAEARFIYLFLFIEIYLYKVACSVYKTVFQQGPARR